MADIQEELAQILTTVKHSGEIVTFLDPPERAIITTPGIIVKFMQGAEQVIGLNGAKILMYTSGYAMSVELAEKIRRFTKASLDDAFRAYAHQSAVRGWGKGTVQECSFEKGTARVEMIRSIFAEGYRDKGETVCNFYAGALAGMMAGYRGKKAQGHEIACVAAGSAACVFQISSPE